MRLKIILGLIIAFGVFSCKLPDTADSGETKQDQFKSTKITSGNLGIAIHMTHEKRVYHDSKNIKENPIEFSVELRNELNSSLEVIESGGDFLRLYINGTERSLAPVICDGLYISTYSPICKYTYSYKSSSVIDESLHVRVTLTRRNGEILAADFNTPAPIQLLEPHIPFNSIVPNGTALLSWQAETSMQLLFVGGTSVCNSPEKEIVLGRDDTYFPLSLDYFLLSPECGAYVNLIATLSTSKVWTELDQNSFNKLDVVWNDSYRVILLGQE